jgi:peptide/nickel transport system substrate-binding protein
VVTVHGLKKMRPLAAVPVAILVAASLALSVAAACSQSDESQPTPAAPTQVALTPGATPGATGAIVDTRQPATPVSTSKPDARVDPDPTARPTETTLPDVTPVSIETPSSNVDAVFGGVLRLVTPEDIVHQDVHFEASPALSTWGPGIAYSRLLRFDSGPDVTQPSLEMRCDLCESWRMVDPVTFEFTLRDGIRWHDDPLTGGRSLVADDVLYSLTRQLGGPNGGLLGSIDDMSLVNDGLLTMTLADPDADFMLGLADARSKIVAREAVELTGDLRDGPTVGTGPWRLTSTGSSGTHSFERFEGYFDGELPYPAELRVHVVEDVQTRDAAFIVGQIDIMELTPFEWDDLKGRLKDPLAISVPETGSGVEFALNPNESPFDDIDVRRAAFASLNPAQAVEDIWLGAGYMSFGFPLNGPAWGLEATDLLGHIASPAEARKLLDGLNLVNVTIKVGRFGDAYVEHANRIADELRAVGFDVTVEEVTRVVFADDVWKGGDYQAFLGPIPPVSSPNAFLFTVVHSAGPYYRGGPPDEELDILIELQGGEYDTDVRRARLKEIQRRMLASAVRFMPVTRNSVWAVQPWVRNFHPNLSGFEYAHWASVWLEP